MGSAAGEPPVAVELLVPEPLVADRLFYVDAPPVSEDQGHADHVGHLVGDARLLLRRGEATITPLTAAAQVRLNKLAHPLR